MLADPTAVQLFDRSVTTLVKSWLYFAMDTPGAELIEANGAAIAIFPRLPQREFLNNTVLPRRVANLGATLDTVARTYADRGVARYAVWVHESEETAAREIETRGYGYDSSTRTMAMPIADLADIDTSALDLGEPTLAGFHRTHGLEADFFPQISADVMHIHVARLNGGNAAALMTIDHEGDCGIYNVGTVPAARRRGLATALTAHAVAQARERGCSTASLQSTEMAESVYASIGFRDLGLFDEYVPAP